MTDLSVRSPSRIAVGLGYLALVPFVAGAAAVWLGSPTVRVLAAGALSAYAATVIAFIGAIHWGLAFSQAAPAPALFVWGVIPSLVAWAALLTRLPIGLGIHAVTLVACYLVDRVVYPRQGVAAYLPLRLRLTGIAALSVAAASAGVFAC